MDDETIELSVIITITGDVNLLKNCLTILIDQTACRSAEIIVPYDETCKAHNALQAEFSYVNFLYMGIVKTAAKAGTQAYIFELYDRRISFGLSHARGSLLAVLADSSGPNPDWCDQVILAHKLLPYGAIGGAVEPGSKRYLNLAVYFQDFGRFHKSVREGQANYLTDVNVSFKRGPLYVIKDSWLDRFVEIVVYQELMKNGEILWQRPQILVWQERGQLVFNNMLKERFAWGRFFGITRARYFSVIKRFLYILLSPVIFLLLLGRMIWSVLISKHNRVNFLISLPIIIPLTLAWWLGELFGTISPKN